MSKPWFCAVAAFALCGSGAFGAALAATPAGIVEEVSGDVGGVEAMDYLMEGQRLHLGVGAYLVASFFAPCAREKIVGGDVVITGGRSVVSGGTVERSPVDCDPGRMILTPSQSEQAAGVVERGMKEKTARLELAPSVQLIVYGSSPLVIVHGDAPPILERVGGDRKREALPAKRDRDRWIYDFAPEGRSLAPGALYRLIAGSRLVVFRVDGDAQPGATPIAGRLILLSAE